MNVVVSRAVSVLPLIMLLAGCAPKAPGGFSRVEVDAESASVQYRYDIKTVERAAMDADALLYCQGKGYDRADPLPATKGAISGTEKQWYKCEWGAATQAR